ncbi:MAG: winged helix-turn-helix transcriptional regulator [Bauldia sp.]|uniref:MarR family winged helix-turn-helix transcriptional regulator n=1 Tax=Bauldia sp. TaxID=2575872 RepID=UPI001E0FA15D|nr:helix-turn-helix domain-containing protein [Bauldia sp.]MCB1494568.1 winged helix-turn-helix transcriptional regulator [Bauldia sp.]
MVKKLDENDWPDALDHVGWRLWQATQRWKRELDEGLVAMGHPWAAEARANVIMHVGRSGIRQSELVRRMGLSKQAVQQLLDGLVADGIVERRPDPEDSRARRIVFTAAGRRMLGDSNRVKKRIEDDYRSVLGEKRFRALMDMLAELNERPPD